MSVQRIIPLQLAKGLILVEWTEHVQFYQPHPNRPPSVKIQNVPLLVPDARCSQHCDLLEYDTSYTEEGDRMILQEHNRPALH
jgi:hypothetical protein